MTIPFQSHVSFRDSWNVQLRVLGALLMRETLTRYGRHNIGFLWLFVEPMIYTLGVTALWTITGHGHGANLPIVGFALTGYSSVLLWRNMPARCTHAIAQNASLMYHRNIRVLDLFIARVALEFGGASISFSVLGTIYVAFGLLAPPEDIFKVLGGWLLLAWFGAALAMLLGALSYRSELVDKIWHPAAYLLFPLSGAAFLVMSLPSAFQAWVLYVPTVHGVELVRDGWFGSHIKTYYNLGYLITFNLVLSAMAMVQIHRLASIVVPE